jgi:hypothetical protein
MLKRWTLLIYANGNNELEPEMLRARLDAEKAGSDASVDVVMQISREDRRLARIMRPSEQIADAAEQWRGTRRYYIRKGKSDLLADLGNLNMAHPMSLYDFVRWSVKNFPAGRCMLVLGGHAFQFVGMMTDFSQDKPYVMGLPEMARALNRVKEDTGQNIDVLVLDTCFMNSVEVIYKLGHEENHAVQNIITFIGGGPIAGLPFGRLAGLVQENAASGDLTFTIKQIIEGVGFRFNIFWGGSKKTS